MFTALANYVANLVASDSQTGAKAIGEGHPLALFYVAGGPIAIKTQGNGSRDGRLLDQFDLPVRGRGRKSAALEAMTTNGWEPLGSALRMGNPAVYAVPVKRRRA